MRASAFRSVYLPADESQPRSDIEPEDLRPEDLQPEDLEDAARSLCAARPGSRFAERLMERAAYLRATRNPFPADRPSASALFLA